MNNFQLEDYHVEPVCTPTRASLMTGRHAPRVGAWTVTQGRQLLGPGEVTMAEVFSDSGYRSGMFGKWHLGDPWPYAPRFRGFQTVVRHLAGGIDEIGNPIGNDCFDDTYFRNGLPEKIDGYCTDVFFAECQRFITEKSGTTAEPKCPSLAEPNALRRATRGPAHYAVLTERWRLVDDALFNIVDDPGRQSNVAPEYADVARDLRMRYDTHLADVFSDHAAYTRFHLGAREENPTLLTVRDRHPTEGNVIWKQEQLGDDALAINGFWAVNVVRAGRYSIRLSRFLEEASQTMGASKAILRLGEQELERDLDRNETSVTFELDLPQGLGLLQSWLSDDEGVVRGAYFVHITRLY